MENIKHLKYVSNSKEVGHPLDPKIKASLINILVCLDCPDDIAIKCSNLFKEMNKNE